MGECEDSSHELLAEDESYEDLMGQLENLCERDNKKITPLHLAAFCSEDKFRILQILLERDVDVNCKTGSEYTPLHYAVCRRNRSAVVALIEAGAFVNLADSLGRTALHFAITKEWPAPQNPLNADCDVLIVERLLDNADINPNPSDIDGATPLMFAVREAHSAAVRLLLKNRADPNIPDLSNRTPLHVAMSAEKPSYEIIYSLLTNGADIYREDNLQQTAMDILIRNISNDETLAFASRLMHVITFRYEIRDTFRGKLERFPMLLNLLDEYGQEVRLMKRRILYENVTLYDYAYNGFQVHPERTIHTAVVETLLTGLFGNYFTFLLLGLKRADLRNVLERAIGTRNTLISCDATHLMMFTEISRCYEQNKGLKQRLLALKEHLINTR